MRLKVQSGAAKLRQLARNLLDLSRSFITRADAPGLILPIREKITAKNVSGLSIVEAAWPWITKEPLGRGSR